MEENKNTNQFTFELKNLTYKELVDSYTKIVDFVSFLNEQKTAIQDEVDKDTKKDTKEEDKQ